MPHRVAIVGAGMGGLACAARLAAAGCAVTVLDRAAAPGGKLRQVRVADAWVDSGPTVLTMRWVFEELFDACGADLHHHVPTTRLHTLARHAWQDGSTLDLHADPAASADAIGRLAGAAAAQGFVDFCARARGVYEALEHSFLRAPRPNPVSLSWAMGLRGMARIDPFATLWQALGQHFADPRLRQLFGRYATYCGSSPMQAPATLMLVAHVEQQGVWSVDGGMQRLADGVAGLAERAGATLRYQAEVAGIETRSGRAVGVILADGERIAADAVVLNADPAALADGLFGAVPRKAAPPRLARSLSAVTWAVVGSPAGLALLRHNVFFSADYRAEFDQLIGQRRLPEDPTIYVCAQDRLQEPAPAASPERLLCIMNAPAGIDALSGDALQAAEARLHTTLRLCGADITCQARRITQPTDFAAAFPGTGGAIYGAATIGPWASFRRPAARSRLPGLYLAGGSVHPGPGVPMAALSGRQAAISVLTDLQSASTSRSRPAAIAGGTWTPSATTAPSAARSLPSSAACSPLGMPPPAVPTRTPTPLPTSR